MQPYPTESSENNATGIQIQTGHLRALHAYRAKTAIPLGRADFFLDGFQVPSIEIEIYSLCWCLSTCNLLDLPWRCACLSRRDAGWDGVWTNEWSLPLNSVKCCGRRWNVRLKSGENTDVAIEGIVSIMAISLQIGLWYTSVHSLDVLQIQMTNMQQINNWPQHFS